MTCINLQLVQNNNLVSDVSIQRSLSAVKEMCGENAGCGLPESAGLRGLLHCAGDLDLLHLIHPFSFLFLMIRVFLTDHRVFITPRKGFNMIF